MCFQKNSTVSLDKQLNSLVVMTLNKREKSATCILCSCGTLKTERFRSRHGCLMSVCMLLCVDSERENKIIYIFFRKWKLYYYLKNKNEPKKTGKRKKIRPWPITSSTLWKRYQSQTWDDICTHCLKTFTGSVSWLQSGKQTWKEGKEKTVYS